MARLFISYARADGRQFADTLSADLDGRGYESWLDRAAISGGMGWMREIEQGIDQCDALLVVLTNAYHASRVAEMELARGSRRQKPLIPMRVHAQAEPPLLLEATQYVDFTEPARYPASLQALVDSLHRLLAGGRAVAPPQAAARDSGDTIWEAVRARTGARTRRFVAENRGTAESPKSFVPELHVRRAAVEDALDRFLAADASALILLGDAGVGKTSLICHWVLGLLEQGHAVLTYDCAALSDADIEREIARDLGVGEGGGLARSLEDLEAQALAGQKNLVMVFDALNDYRGSERDGVQVLLKRINALVGRLTGRLVRVVTTCTTATWNRLDRLGPVRLDWSRYFGATADEPLVRLEPFTVEEFDAAYPRYQRFFDLSSPLETLNPTLRERLREPVLLRMMAEAYRGLAQPVTTANLAVGIYRRMFEERVRLPKDALFVDDLAGEMLRLETASVPVSDLARHERLGPDVLSENESTTYCRLMDRGVLQESRGDLRTGTLIKFAYSRLGAYAVATHLLKRSSGDADALGALIAGAARFPLAWDTGKMLLLLTKAQPSFVALAESLDIERRELAAEALVELFAEDPQTAQGLLEHLLDRESERARRTALKAAYNIGPPARAIFLRAALASDDALRQAARDTLYLIWRHESPAVRQKTTDSLYLIWRHAPGFTYEFLDELLERISLRNVRSLPGILKFVLDLSITIYVNHCDHPDVIERTARLYHDLATRRLHLDLVNTGMLGRPFEKLVFRAVAAAFSEPILSWILSGSAAEARAFFDLPLDRRACLARIADTLDPSSTLDGVREDLATMLDADAPVFSGAAALAIAVHACRDFPNAEPVIRHLFDRSGPSGRQWLLLSFAVLLPDTPREWVGLLEELTDRYVREHMDLFRQPPKGVLGDLVLLPLGLAYGKTGSPMSPIAALIRQATADGDRQAVARTVGALGPVGFYYPHAMFDVLRSVDGLEPGDVQESLVSSLAVVRTLHFDAVDRFLDQIAAPEPLRRRIDAAADVDRVRRYIHVLGYYNNAVHYTLNYPRMRRQLAMGALKLLAEGRSSAQFVADYTATAVRMFRDADFQLIEWTRPE